MQNKKVKTNQRGNMYVHELTATFCKRKLFPPSNDICTSEIYNTYQNMYEILKYNDTIVNDRNRLFLLIIYTMSVSHDSGYILVG